MRIRFVALAGLAFASLSLLAPAASAQGFEKVLPGDALVFVGIDDVTKMKDAAGESPSGKLWHDPACASLREAADKLLALLSKKGIENAGVDPVVLLNAIKGPAAFAVLELSEPKSTGAKAFTMSGAFTFLFDVGQDGDAVMTQIETALDKVKDQPGMTRSAETSGDVEVTLLEIGDPADEERMQVRIGLADHVLVIVAGSASVAAKDYLGTIVANLKAGGGDDDALADADGFSNSLAGTEGTGARMYVDTQTLVSRVRAIAEIEKGSSPDEKKMIEGLGLDDIGALSMFGEFAAEGATSDVHLAWSGQGAIVTGLQTMFPKGAPELLGLVPDTSKSAVDMHIDLLGTFDHVIATMKDLGMVTEEELKVNLQTADQEIGLSIRDDLLAKIGTELAYFIAPVDDETQALNGTEDDPSNFAVVLRLKDGKKLETIVDDLIVKSGMGAARKHTDFQGFNINTMPIPGGMGNASYVFTDDMLVFSLATELVQGVVRRTASGTDLPNLAGKSEVAALFDDAPKESSVFVVSDAAASIKDVGGSLRNMVSYVMHQGKPRSQMSPEEQQYLDLLKSIEFPSDEVIEKYVKGYTLGAFTVDDDGAHLHTKQ